MESTSFLTGGKADHNPVILQMPSFRMFPAAFSFLCGRQQKFLFLPPIQPSPPFPSGGEVNNDIGIILPAPIPGFLPSVLGNISDDLHQFPDFLLNRGFRLIVVSVAIGRFANNNINHRLSFPAEGSAKMNA